MPSFSLTRALVVLCLLSTTLVAMSGRVAWLETLGRQRILHAAERQQYVEETLQARRGTLFDRNMFALAVTVQRQRLYIDPKFILESYRDETRKPGELDAGFAHLASALEMEPKALMDLIHARPDDRYQVIAENLDENAADEVNKLHLPGVGMEPTSKRFYPLGPVAAHIIGAVGKDDTGRGEKGLEGLELMENDLLAGKDGRKRTLHSGSRKEIGVSDEDYLPALHGQHLILTIDANIQIMAEEELAAACEANKAKRGEIVVMDPRTGDIIAMANYPRFNPQNLEDSSADLRRNRCLTDPFEAGSVIKPFIVGPALAWRLTTPDHIWPIPGLKYTTPYGRTITDVHGYPPLTMWDVLVKSSNIGMCLLAEHIGPQKLRDALDSFRFGQVTGVTLPAENHGKLFPMAKWTRASLESVAQGYEIMVTPMQLARAFCAYANGGRLVAPRLILGQLDAAGHLASESPAPRLEDFPQVIDPATAAEIRRILCDVPVRGTATSARSNLYNIFGKTGTAHIAEHGHYSETRFNSSFIGGAPYENPRLIVTVLIHEPDKSIAHYGGAVSAPPAQRLLDRALSYMGVPQSGDVPLPDPSIQSKLFGYNAKVYKKPAPGAKHDVEH